MIKKLRIPGTLLPRTVAYGATLLACISSSGCSQTAMVGDEDLGIPFGTGGSTVPATTGGEGGFPLPLATGGAGGGGGTGTTVGAGGTGGTTVVTTQVTTRTEVPCNAVPVNPGVLRVCGRTISVAYSPDGQLLAMGTEDGQPGATVWRLSDGALVFTPSGSTSETTYAVAFSPDGQLLATAGMLRDNNESVAFVRLWQVSTGTMLRTLAVNTGWYADALSFSHDGTLLATGGMQGDVEIWRVADGTRVRGMPVPSTAHNVHFSPDDSMLIAGVFDGQARIWNTQTGALVRTLAITNEMADADFSPDGKQIASTGDGNVVKIWDAASGKLLQLLSGHSVYVSHVVWVDQNRLLSDDWSGVVNLWRRGNDGSFSLSSTWSTGGQALGLAVSPDKTQFVTGGGANGRDGLVFFLLD